MSKSNISRNEQEIFWSEQYAEDYIKKMLNLIQV